jgi:putative flippase GtrA
MWPLKINAVWAVRSVLIIRWMKFNAVGAIGITVQLSALAVLGRVLKLPVALATGLAVETAIVHNFVWHRGWTWADRKRRTRSGAAIEALRILLRFNLTTGLVSLLGNMLLMHLLVGTAGFGLLRSNLLTIAICSVMNFIVSDRVVFTIRQ